MTIYVTGNDGGCTTYSTVRVGKMVSQTTERNLRSMLHELTSRHS
jgi:hypothetical protein